MHYKLKQKAIYLRTESRLSYSAILAKIPVAKSTLSNWLRPYPLNKEEVSELKKVAWKKNEVKIELFRTTMREKRAREDNLVYQKYLKQFRKLPKSSLFTAGLMLYLAEGSKTDPYKIVLTNTDHRMLRFFIEWLEIFFEIPGNKLKLFIQLYKTMNIEKEVDFWTNELGVNRSQVYKPFMRKLKPSSFSYKESFRHGTCAVILNNTYIKRRVMMAIKAYLDVVFLKYARVAQG